jgi:hypothetical protein
VGCDILPSGGLGIVVQFEFPGKYRDLYMNASDTGLFKAVQIVVDHEEISLSISAIVASQNLGSAVFVSVGITILQNQLLHGVTSRTLAQIDVGEVILAGATRFRTIA